MSVSGASKLPEDGVSTEPSLGSGETWSPSACRPLGLDFRAEEIAASKPKARRGRRGAGLRARASSSFLAAAIHD